MNITHIVDNIFLGGAIDDYNELEEKKINIVVNIRAEQHDDICELTKRNISYFYLPVSDNGAPRIDQIKSFLNLINMNKDKNIYIHCAVGRGRSVMLVSCYLLSCNMEPIEAVEFIKNLRPEVSLTDTQNAKLIRYYEEKCGVA